MSCAQIPCRNRRIFLQGRNKQLAKQAASAQLLFMLLQQGQPVSAFIKAKGKVQK